MLVDEIIDSINNQLFLIYGLVFWLELEEEDEAMMVKTRFDPFKVLQDWFKILV